MKKNNFAAALLTISILLTGCGGTSSHNAKDSTMPAATENTEAELTNINTIITSKADDGNTAAISATETVSSAVTSSAVASNEQPKSSELPAEAPVYTGALTHGVGINITTTAKTTKTILTATTAITTLAATTTTVTTNLLPKVVLDSMTLEQKVCQMFIVTPEALTGISPMTSVGGGTQKALAEYPVGGIIYFAQNMTSQEQMKNMISTTQGYAREACGIGLFTAVDEEGGQVARCAQKLGTTAFNSMAYYGELNDSNTAYNIGRTIGKDIRALGFNVDFAPVADVNLCSANELGNRIFSSDPKVVANMSSNVVKGLQYEGVCATLKHFPGLGAENGNTHTNSTVFIDRTLNELREAEFIPFKESIKAGANFVMIGHQIVTGFGDELPCDLSYKAVTEMLRKELGFDGIAITDSQQMNTISTVYSSGEAAKLSIKAGVDIILMPVDYKQAIDDVCQAVRSGDISEKRINESVMRILRKKSELGLLKK